MMETKRVTPRGGQRLPMRASRLQQRISADEIGFDKSARPVNGTVNMAFGSKMYDHIGTHAHHHLRNTTSITNIHPAEPETRVFNNIRKRGQGAGIGQFINDMHMVMCLRD